MRRLAAAGAALALSACAGLSPPPAPAAAAVVDEPFALSARLSARRDAQGAAAHLDWAHEPGRDTIEFATPMGSTLARLSRDSAGALVELADGRTIAESRADALAERTLGFALPIDGLAWWIRGVARPGSAHAAERDSRGRAIVLAQDGWTVVYTYADEGSARPSRIDARFPGLDVRIVVDEWRPR